MLRAAGDGAPPDIPATLVNISRTGLGFRTSAPLEDGTRLRFALMACPGRPAPTAAAHLVRQSEPVEGRYDYGAEFLPDPNTNAFVAECEARMRPDSRRMPRIEPAEQD